jgi:hypothetical protein
MRINQTLIDSLRDDYGLNREEALTKLIRDEIDKEIINNIISLGDSDKGNMSLDLRIEYNDTRYESHKYSRGFSSIAVAALKKSIELRGERIFKKHCQ